jgi:hypothetical protein
MKGKLMKTLMIGSSALVLCLTLFPKFVNSQTVYDVVGVEVAKPFDAVVRPDEGIELEGAIRVLGGEPNFPIPYAISGSVKIGYYIEEVVLNPFTGKLQLVEMRFVVVRIVTVDASVPPNSGVYAGAGTPHPFTKFVEATPNWQEHRIYYCIGNPSQATDRSGTFAVGIRPSDSLWKLLQIILDILCAGGAS